MIAFLTRLFRKRLASDPHLDLINRQIADARAGHKPTANLLAAKRAYVHARLAGFVASKGAVR